jgi:hypothetical protein
MVVVLDDSGAELQWASSADVMDVSGQGIN